MVVGSKSSILEVIKWNLILSLMVQANQPATSTYTDLLIINEAMPQPTIDYNNNEKFEVYNDQWIEITSLAETTISLNGFLLGDGYNHTKYMIQDTIIHPDEYLVLYGSQTHIRLNKGGENIYLIDDRGGLIDSTQYQTSQQDYSVGRHQGGGGQWTSKCTPTPETINDCAMTTTTSTTTTSTTQPLPDPPVEETTTTTTPTTTTTTPTSTTTTTTTSTTTTTTIHYDLLITELMINPKATADKNGEYVEVYNTGTQAFNLENLILRDGDHDSHTINTSTTIQPDEHILLCKNSNPFENGNLQCSYEYTGFTLSNTEDEAILASKHKTIDKVEYNQEYPLEEGASLSLDERLYTRNLNNNPQAWCPSTKKYGDGDKGTPGTINERCSIQDSKINQQTPTTTTTTLPVEAIANQTQNQTNQETNKPETQTETDNQTENKTKNLTHKTNPKTIKTKPETTTTIKKTENENEPTQDNPEPPKLDETITGHATATETKHQKILLTLATLTAATAYHKIKKK